MTSNNTKSDSIQHNPSCMDDFDPASIDAKQALQLILNQVDSLNEKEEVEIREALNRTLAENISSTIDVPGHTNSAMDGYAIHSSDIPLENTTTLINIGTAWAGRPYKGEIKKGECARIMTGAAMPDGTDTVVMQEHVELDGDKVLVGHANQAGQNVRQAGEDIPVGGQVLNKGKVLTPADLGLLASVGISKVSVVKKLRVAFFSTGDELRPVGSQLEVGQIYDSNRYTLHGMLMRLGVEIIDLGVIEDKREAVEQAFIDAADKANVIITSGGVSVGDADFVKETLEKIGEVNFWKVAMKPGRPLAFGKIKNTWFFGLPGNPVSVMVTFYMFVQPALKKLTGSKYQAPLMIRANCQTKLRKRPGRVEYQRGILTQSENDPTQYKVIKTGAQGSGILRSMSDANCFIILSMESEGVEEGDNVQVLPFDAII
ncbi:MAG: molybdopterin molybdotransferase MoeA [Gammaproteobacteria bacterium]|nr:molybdopterin molybdotransferase MoeA [Gammaproteobacteria bacterium]